MGDKRLAPIAVELAEQRLQLIESTWVFWVAIVFLAPLAAVTVLQGDVVWALGCFALLAYFLYWLLLGRARLRTKLEGALEKNRKLIPAERERKPGAKRKTRPESR